MLGKGLNDMSQAIRLFNSNREPVYPCPYYPIGSIYMSVTNNNPANIFGGKWERIKDRFLLCAGDSYSAGSTGGSTNHYHSTGSHKLTINEMPSHTHTYFRTRAIWAEDAADESTAVGCNNTWAYGKTYPDTYATGGNQAHNHGNTGNASNLPPYLAIYVWKRIG